MLVKSNLTNYNILTSTTSNEECSGTDNEESTSLCIKSFNTGVKADNGIFFLVLFLSEDHSS